VGLAQARPKLGNNNTQVYKQWEVDRKNQGSKDKAPYQLQSAMINLYQADKHKCTKHVSALDGISATYSDKCCKISITQIPAG